MYQDAEFGSEPLGEFALTHNWTRDPAPEPDGWGFLDTRGKIPDQEYRVDRIVPEGEVSLMFAAAGDGKSLTALYMAYCITKELPFYNLATKRGPVLYIDSETHNSTARRRLSRILDGPAATDILYIEKPGLLTNDAAIKRILDYVKSKGVEQVLTIVDSLQSATFLDNLNANQIIATFAQLNEAFGTVLVLDHTPLGDDGRPIGTSFKKNCVRSLFGLRTKAHEGDSSMSVRFTQTKVNDDERLTGCGGTMFFEGERGKGHIRFEPITKGEVEMNRKDEILEWIWRMGCVISTDEVVETWGAGATRYLTALAKGKDAKVFGDGRGHWTTIAKEYPESMKTYWSEWQKEQFQLWRDQAAPGPLTPSHPPKESR